MNAQQQEWDELNVLFFLKNKRCWLEISNDDKHQSFVKYVEREDIIDTFKL